MQAAYGARCLFAVAFLSAATARCRASPFSGVLLQSFEWDELANRAVHSRQLLAEVSDWIGVFDAVWLPPPSQSADPQGYMPQHWHQLVGEADLRILLKAASDAGIAPIADVVVNHRTAPNLSGDGCLDPPDWVGFEDPQMGPWAITSDDFKCEGGSKYCNCDCGQADTGDNFCGAPDLDHSSLKVQDLVLEYLAFLKAVGFTGWRFDMAKGYSGAFVRRYTEESGAAVAMGEFFDGDTDLVMSWLEQAGPSVGALDFPFLLNGVQPAFSSSSYFDFSRLVPTSGVVGRSSAQAFTFLQNHDIYRDESSPFGRSAPDSQIEQGYVILLSHPGNPVVFRAHWLRPSVQALVRTLVDARRQSSITSTSPLQVIEARQGLYAAIVTGSSGMVAVKVGNESWNPDLSEFSIVASGENYAVWMSAGKPKYE